ncbi:MAG: CHAT domain-containing protein [Spirulinaceae cyanobacterium]
MCQEFVISVTPLGEDEYLVRTEKVAPGVPPAEEKVHWLVNNWLEQGQELMDDPILRLLQGQNLLGDKFAEELFSTSEDNKLEKDQAQQSRRNLVSLGQQLYEALFQGSLLNSWMIAQGIADNHRACLRLRLGLKDAKTRSLPWEVLHAEDRPLATGVDIAFSRYQPNTLAKNLNDLSPLAKNQSLKILMAIAGPNDQESLELKEEAIQLTEELQRHGSQNSHNLPPVEVTLLEQPGREELTQALEQGKYQIFHYAGHSGLGDSGGGLYLVSRKTGLTEVFSGEDLAGLLVNNKVQLAVFNSCRGAKTEWESIGDQSPRSNLADAAIKRGVPAVLAMAERIPDAVALNLTRLLYRNISQGHPIDLSLSRARQGLIATYGSNQLYWALPILYLAPEFPGIIAQAEATEGYSSKLVNLTQGRDSGLTEEEEKALLFSPQTLDFIQEEQLDSYPHNQLNDDGELTKADWLEEEEEEKDNLDEDRALIEDMFNQLTPNRSAKEEGKPVSETSLDDSPSVSEQELKPPHQRREHWIQGLSPLLLGAVSAIAIAALGFWLFSERLPFLKSSPLPGDEVVTSLDKPGDLAKADNDVLTGLAIEEFSQKDLQKGIPAVAALLDRGALEYAKSALEAVPTEQINEPDILFLKGRLAWQAAQSGDEKFSVDDARRFWESAIKEQENSPVTEKLTEAIPYHNALGFAYYAEGKYNEANQAWYDALELAEQTETLDSDSEELLDAYAGLALGLNKLAEAKSPEDSPEFLADKAIKLRKMVITKKPKSFTPEALSQNWLWPPEAIEDWQELLSMNNEQ